MPFKMPELLPYRHIDALITYLQQFDQRGDDWQPYDPTDEADDIGRVLLEMHYRHHPWEEQEPPKQAYSFTPYPRALTPIEVFKAWLHLWSCLTSDSEKELPEEAIRILLRILAHVVTSLEGYDSARRVIED